MRILKEPVQLDKTKFPQDGQYVREAAKGNPGDADYKPARWYLVTAEGKRLVKEE